MRHYATGREIAAAIFFRLTFLLQLCLPATVVSAEDPVGQTGEFSINVIATDLFSEEKASEFAPYVDAEHVISWEVYVPQGYDPDQPAGLLTYISPTRSGRILEEWKPLLSERNMIWIGANNSGNAQTTPLRVIYAVLGTGLIKNSYSIDSDRVYVSGFSGGGRVSSWAILEYPHIYKGAIYICGVNFWQDGRDDLDRFRDHRYVFLTGTNDFNYQDTRNVFSKYRRAGFENIDLLTVTNMGHRLPDAKDFIKALDFVDPL